jgi:hypothetical protein
MKDENLARDHDPKESRGEKGLITRRESIVRWLPENTPGRLSRA